jgi:hypothetical protein
MANARSPTRARQLLEPFAPAVLDGRGHEAEQRVVKLVGVARLRSRLGDDAGDGVGIERTEIALVLGEGAPE